MSYNKGLRDELVFQLTRGNAHMTFEDAIKDFPEAHYNTMITDDTYSFWQLLEHMRRTQADILNFMINPKYKELEWPKDYWPEKSEKATKKEWEATIKGFLADRAKLVKITLDPKTDLFEKISWGTGQTIIREILVVVDHNSNELGEFAIARQVHKTWDKGPL